MPTPPLDRAKARREELAVAADGLERALTRPSGDEAAWRTATLTALDDLGAALTAHVDEVESPEGLFPEIMRRSPRLAHAIERLRADHTTLADRIDQLQGSIRSAASVDEVRESAVTLLAEISRHRHRGADLIWESYNFDIGEGD